MQMLIEMISTAEVTSTAEAIEMIIVVTTTMITVRDELLSFPAKSGILLLLNIVSVCVYIY